MTNAKPKVFGVGLNKTGTTTLALCGKILGYRYASCSRQLLEDVVRRRDYEGVKTAVTRFDLFQDWPWPLIYRELDEMFPGSKFILTRRSDEHTWLQSLKKHSLRTRPFEHCRKLVYGYSYPQQHEQHFLDFYRRHNAAVRRHFQDRNADFIELCWERGDSWEELCEFLGVQVPDFPFPHGNKGSAQRASKSRQLLNQVLQRISA